MADEWIDKERQGWIDLLNEYYVSDVPLVLPPKHCSMLAILLGDVDSESFKRKLAEKIERDKQKEQALE